MAWLFALRGPLASLSAILLKVVDENGAINDGAVAALSKVSETITLVSALFTTIVGTVVGYYFGQRGQERAEKALAEDRMEFLRESSVDAEAADESVADIDALRNQAELLDRAVAEAVDLLPEEVQIDPDSALGEMLSTHS